MVSVCVTEHHPILFTWKVLVMSFAIAGIPGDKELLDFSAINRSAGMTANAAYIEEFGVEHRDDPEWNIGGERHAFWLNVFDNRWKALIINPHQD
jgi:hypothetical protein